jgi:hypothetical protein
VRQIVGRMLDTKLRNPTLDDAKARIERARTHIANLEAAIATFLPPDRTITTPIMSPAFISSGKQYVYAPSILAILIGETIYNLRGALDYLIYELFQLDTGKIKEHTQFLIEDTPTKWTAHLPGAGINRLTAPHQAALQALQPCFGCKWTGALRDYSNPDKHRQLTTIEASVNHGGHGMVGGVGPVMVTTQLTTKVAFEDGSFVVDTLKMFEREVAKVIQAFDPDFR